MRFSRVLTLAAALSCTTAFAGEITLVPTDSGALDLDVLPTQEIFGLAINDIQGEPVVSLTRQNQAVLGPFLSQIVVMDTNFSPTAPQQMSFFVDSPLPLRTGPNLVGSPDQATFIYSPQTVDLSTLVPESLGPVDRFTYQAAGRTQVVECQVNFAGNPALAVPDAVVDNGGRATFVCPNFDDAVPDSKGVVVAVGSGDVLSEFPIGNGGPSIIAPKIANVPKPGGGTRQAIVAHTATGTPEIMGYFLELDASSQPTFVPFTVHSVPPSFEASFPEIFVDPQTGDFLVGWTDVLSSGGFSRHKVRGFDCDGNPKGPEVEHDFPGPQDFEYTPTAIEGLRALAIGEVSIGDTYRYTVTDGTGQEVTQYVTVDHSPDVPAIQTDVAVGFLPAQRGTNARFVSVFVNEPTGGRLGEDSTELRYQVFEIAGLEDPRLFEDRFESGDTSAWSQVVP